MKSKSLPLDQYGHLEGSPFGCLHEPCALVENVGTAEQIASINVDARRDADDSDEG